jgi:hypothetical protein
MLVATMFIHRNKKCVQTKTGIKTYNSILLVENYREGKKVKHRSLANLSNWPVSLIESFEKLLKGETFHDLKDLNTKQGKSCGALIVLYELAKEIGILQALGDSKNAKLTLLMILGRILTQGSRLHLVSWKNHQAVEEVLKIDHFNEDDLYYALDWLNENQLQVEKALFNFRYSEKKESKLFLYDVTSSYFEGKQNELSDYGYNRDGKKGKKQIVIGLLTDENGIPVAVEVFKGNTADPTTIANQIKKLAEEFKVTEITLVGDRGMIKSTQIKQVQSKEWHYITAITKPQIEKLIKKGVFQLGLFEEQLTEVTYKDVRYILRRNPERVKEVSQNRYDKINFIKIKIQKANTYLHEHTKASVKVAVRNMLDIIKRIKMQSVLKVSIENSRTLLLKINQEELVKQASLDGCYVIKTDLKPDKLETNLIHDRYKDLSEIEQCFSGSSFLEF